MTPGEQMARRARTLLGTPFRLQGRDPATGLDCVGVVLSCLDAAGRGMAFPATYGLHNSDIAPLLAFAERDDVDPAAGPARPGDVLLVTPGPWQHHLLVALGPASFVHAHAALRSVVETPFPSPWPVLRGWRLS